MWMAVEEKERDELYCEYREKTDDGLHYEKRHTCIVAGSDYPVGALHSARLMLAS